MRCPSENPNALLERSARRCTSCGATIGAIPLVAEKWDRRSSPRPISTAQLKESPLLHPRPINQMVSLGSYPVIRWEILSWSGLRT